MQENRRSFAKKLALLAGVSIASVGLVNAKESSKDMKSSMSNGVVLGSSNKNEILYSKTYAWEEYYRNAT